MSATCRTLCSASSRAPLRGAGPPAASSGGGFGQGPDVRRELYSHQNPKFINISNSTRIPTATLPLSLMEALRIAHSASALRRGIAKVVHLKTASSQQSAVAVTSNCYQHAKFSERASSNNTESGAQEAGGKGPVSGTTTTKTSTHRSQVSGPTCYMHSYCLASSTAAIDDCTRRA
jgi:hypothetical protein